MIFAEGSPASGFPPVGLTPPVFPVVVEEPFGHVLSNPIRHFSQGGHDRLGLGHFEGALQLKQALPTVERSGPGLTPREEGQIESGKVQFGNLQGREDTVVPLVCGASRPAGSGQSHARVQFGMKPRPFGRHPDTEPETDLARGQIGGRAGGPDKCGPAT
jgi:hypothetical protein